MNAPGEAIHDVKVTDVPFDFEVLFRTQYERIARVIARVVKNPARAEELAVEVFWKLLRNPQARGPQVEGWLYRSAVRIGLDELRRQSRRARYERLFVWAGVSTPEDVRAANEEQQQVRAVLAVLDHRQAELLVLRSHGLSYEELASALQLNPASVGTFLSRAQQAFRKEYTQRYGQQ